MLTVAPVAIQALAGGVFAWLAGLLGAAFILVKKDFSQPVFDAMLGFAGGIMLAAVFWSLLEPALQMAGEGSLPFWLPAALGVAAGASCLAVLDRILPHLHLNFPPAEAEGPKTGWQRSVLLVMAITLHNIPEGLAVGVAIGAAAAGLPEAATPAVAALVIGIGVHNIPESLAVSVSLRREGVSRLKSFWYGQLSALVFPPAALAGALAVARIDALLPWALGFAAGAMLFVVIEEVVPESQRQGNTDLATGGAIAGFLLMMLLDLTLG